ncbi:MAG: hypothetical protein LUC30_07315 [Clostridiales bacterium]|nr:hypothetical protein [Clostridiales bacterium]
MSKFSEYLKTLIDASGEPISSIARSIGAERTSIHKALKDERVLSSKTVHALAAHLQLSLEERQEFFRLYDMLLQGEDHWRNRTAVCEMLNHLSAIQFLPEVTETEMIGASARALPLAYDYKLIEGEYSVQSALYSVLSWELEQAPDAHFQMFLPFGMDFASIFMHFWRSGAQFTADQLFCFPSGANTNCTQSIKILQQIIPLCLLARGFYHPYYFYEHPGARFLNPLNYYIITPHYLILLSQDQSTALIQRSEQLVGYFSNHFNSLLDHCDPFISFATTLPEILKVNTTMLDRNGSLCVMSQPCFGRYSTPEKIAKYLRGTEVLPEGMYPTIVSYFTQVQAIEKDFCSIFSEKGLQRFIETGQITEIPPTFVAPIDPPDRLLFLSQLREDIAADRVIGRIARQSALRIPDYLTLYIDTNGNAWMDTTADFIHGAYCCNIHITERSICRAFLDFFQSLPGSQLVYSKEETLRSLDEGIQGLQKTE